MTAIADAIREKTGGSTQLTPAEMVDAILGIKSRIEFTRDDSGNIVGVSLYGLSEVPEKAFYQHTFSGSTTLQWVDFTNSPGISKIGNSAFSGCTALTSINLPDTITEIGTAAFSGCTALTSINFPDSLTKIGAKAFSNCRSLQFETLPQTIKSIGESAFLNCSALTNVEIQCNLTPGPTIFKECTGLKCVWIRSTCNTISGTTNYGSSAPFVGAGIYGVFGISVEHKTKPSGFFNRFEFKDRTTKHPVEYGVTERPW